MLISLNDLENDWKCHYSNWLTNWQTDQPKNRLINFTNHMHYKKQQHRFKAISSFYCFKMLFLEYLIVAKALDGQRYPLPLCECMRMWGGERRWWEEPMTYAVFIWAWRLELGPWSWDLSLEAGIWASWLRFEPWDWDLSLEVGVWAWRLGFVPQDLDLSLEAGICSSSRTTTNISMDVIF